MIEYSHANRGIVVVVIAASCGVGELGSYGIVFVGEKGKERGRVLRTL